MRVSLPSAALSAGYTLQHREEVHSTNDLALAAALEGQDKIWFVADAQNAGRGRHGRVWHSPPGNLYASLALSAPCAPANAPKLGFVAGIALARAIMDVAPSLASRFHLKWPNDGLLDGMKVAGILLEGGITMRGQQAVALGIGVNLAHHPERLEQPATNFVAHQTRIAPAQFFVALAAYMGEALIQFANGDGFPAICEEWQRYALPPQTPMRVRLSTGEQRGYYAGLNAEGHLQLSSSSGITTLLVGDVFLDKAAAIPCVLEPVT